jgi:crotonobetainyl-CoA:carnitine CoA-transferase CaiB-like acyl-CoA transferase
MPAETPEPRYEAAAGRSLRRGPAERQAPGALIGEHTEEVLAEVGYDAEEIASLGTSGALGKVPREFA